MSMILALWNRNGEPVDEELLRSMAAVGGGPESDGPDVWLGKNVGLGQRHFWSTPQEQAWLQPLVDSASGCVITSAARLDNRPELIHALGLAGEDAKTRSDAELILGAYRRWGVDCAARLLGDFAFIIWDPLQRRLFAARDALGGQELYYFLNRDYLIMARRISSLLKHPSVQPKLNETKIARYLAVYWGEDVDTFYEDIFHLPPAHCLLVTAESARLWRYWEIDPKRTIRVGRPQEYAEAYRELIKEGLRCRLPSAYPPGLSLSGGLDSSALACLAAEVLAERGSPGGSLGSYSYVFDELPNCDERRYIQPVIEQVARQYPIHPRMLSGDKLWPSPFAQDWFISRDYPWQDPYYYLLKAILQTAHQDGVRNLLSGFYGDDLYSGAEFWFADFLLAGRFGQAARIMGGSMRQMNIKSDLLEHGLRAMIPAGLKRTYRAFRPRPLAWAEWLHPDLVARVGLDKQPVMPGIQAKFRLPGGQARYSALFCSGYPESVTALQDIARESGMEYLFPFMDRRIVEFVLGLPPEQVGRPGVSRRILREALKGKLPEVIRQRPDKTPLFDLFERGVYEKASLDLEKDFRQSQVIERGFIRRDWLNVELKSKWRTQAGFILWLVISLEGWLQKYW
jgi:asparagine synthase (glutamine-hydrolysing)